LSRSFDVIVIGTGTAGSILAHACREAGRSVAVVDRRPYGGTCALRGCQPKKYLVAAAEIAGLSRDLRGLGIGEPARIDWPALMAHKAAFTDAVPSRTEKGFAKAGITTLHGTARFTGAQSVSVDGEDHEAATIVIATGARPRPLTFPGAEHVVTSEDFLALPELPRRIVFVGGGYVAMEFAHVAARAGAEPTVLEYGDRVLKLFDADLVEHLAAASREAGITMHTGTKVCEVRHEQDAFVVCGDTTDGRDEYGADLVVHGAGRVPDLDDLDLDAAGVEHSGRGVAVNEFMQSPSNSAVFAIGDVADAPPQLAPVADREAAVAAENIVHGPRRAMDRSLVPSVVFTLPPMAGVGLTEAQATEQGLAVKINAGETAGWPSSRRIGQKHGTYKVLQDEATGRILGAHILGHGAGDMINLFALAVGQGLSGRELKEICWAYPTSTSDIKYMVSD